MSKPVPLNDGTKIRVVCKQCKRVVEVRADQLDQTFVAYACPLCGNVYLHPPQGHDGQDFLAALARAIHGFVAAKDQFEVDIVPPDDK